MSIPVDPEIIEEVATELAVNEAFVEKDWYALHLIALILTAPDTNYTPVFSGGTSLSKGFNLIQMNSTTSSQKRKSIGERLAEKPRVFTYDPYQKSEREIRKRNCYSHWDGHHKGNTSPPN